MVANDFLTDKMPSEWGNIVKEGRDGYLKFDYSMCVPLLWSALQYSLNEIDDLKKEVKKLNKDNEASPKAKAKAKAKNKN